MGMDTLATRAQSSSKVQRSVGEGKRRSTMHNSVPKGQDCRCGGGKVVEEKSRWGTRD